MQTDSRDTPARPEPAAPVSGAGSIAAPAAQAQANARDAALPPAGTSAAEQDWGPKERVRSAATFVGAKVLDSDGTVAGEVTEIMIDTLTGRVAYVVVSVGAVLGIGGERYAVPWTAVRHDPATRALRLSVSRDVLTKAPLVESEFWPEMTDDERWSRAVHEHFRATPYWQR